MKIKNTIKKLRLQVRKFCNEKIAPLAEETDRKNAFPNHLWKEFGKMGLLGMTVSSKKKEEEKKI
jgi:isovaleryl-CoA dehydrogenase